MPYKRFSLPRDTLLVTQFRRFLPVQDSPTSVVLEKDLYKIPPADISTTKVKLTMMNGNVTYRAE